MSSNNASTGEGVQELDQRRAKDNNSAASEQYSTIEVVVPKPPANGAHQIPNKPHGSSGKYSRQYVLPDGSIAMTGKGLGKGRPGIKRGPRLGKSPEPESASTSTVVSQQPYVAHPTTPNGTKRKRADSGVSHGKASSAMSSQSRDSTPEYNPSASQTRSGRQTQRPASIITVSPVTENPVPKRVSSTPTSTPNFKSHPKIKRRVYKGKEQFALCEHCLRSFGPPNNVIVFCDACNKCWHQRCHDPQISKDVVADTKAEWFCATCDKILHGSKKAKKNSTSTPTPTAKLNPQMLPQPLAPPPPPTAPIQKYCLPLIPPSALTRDQRIAYLNSLNKDQLINMMLYASDLAPQMPIYETPLPIPPPPPPQPQPQFASNYVTPVDTAVLESRGIANTTEPGDEIYEDRFDEHALLYPKTGEGFQLPPDQVDLHMLLEGPESRTFSHWVRGMNMKTYCDNVSLVVG